MNELKEMRFLEMCIKEALRWVLFCQVKLYEENINLRSQFISGCSYNCSTIRRKCQMWKIYITSRRWCFYSSICHPSSRAHLSRTRKVHSRKIFTSKYWEEKSLCILTVLSGTKVCVVSDHIKALYK